MNKILLAISLACASAAQAHYIETCEFQVEILTLVDSVATLNIEVNADKKLVKVKFLSGKDLGSNFPRVCSQHVEEIQTKWIIYEDHLLRDAKLNVGDTHKMIYTYKANPREGDYTPYITWELK